MVVQCLSSSRIPRNLHVDDGRPFTNSFVVVYLDGILIFIHILEEHIHHIQQVLQTLQQHKLCANLEKFTFGIVGTIIAY